MLFHQKPRSGSVRLTVVIAGVWSLLLCGCRSFDDAPNRVAPPPPSPAASAAEDSSEPSPSGRTDASPLAADREIREEDREEPGRPVATASAADASETSTAANGSDTEGDVAGKDKDKDKDKDTVVEGEAEGGEGEETDAISEAEKVSRVRRGLDEDRQRLRTLQETLEDPESDYARAERAFNSVDRQFDAKKKELEKARETTAREQIARLESELEKLRAERKIARERFDLAIADRKILVEQIATLQTRIEQAEQSLKQLTGAPAEEPPDPTAAPDAAESAAETAPEVAEKPAPERPVEQPPPAPSAPTPSATAPDVTPAPPAAAGDGEAAPAPAAEEAQPEGKKPTSKQVAEARKELAEKQEVARGAEEAVERVTSGVDALKKDIEAESALLESARKLVRVEQAARENLQNELAEKRREGAPPAEIAALQARLEETTANLRRSRERVDERTAQLADLRQRLTQKQAEEIALLKTASQRQREAWWARLKVVLLEWLFEHGPKILLILVGMTLALFLTRFLSKRIIGVIVRTSREEDREDRDNRATTLVGVFQNAAWVVIIVWAVVSILTEVGFPVGPVLGGAAVAGLAVAFGAQRLIRDFFHGFVILLENQYGINDVVRVAGIAGLVERITLRMTVLRDLEGVVHFIPNGEITSVSNMTHGWSRALFDVGVAYKEDIDEVIEIIQELGREMRQDPKFGRLILEDLTMLGLDMMADSALVVKFFIKTRPLKQWDVKREMLRRIKRRFDERGIEIPFPHRTIYHRHEDEKSRLAEKLVES